MDHETIIIIIIDDGYSFTFLGDDILGNAGFYTSDTQNAPPYVEDKCEQKFAPKLLV